MTSIVDIIRRRAKEAGVDPTQALAFARLESSTGTDPKPGNGGGLYQLSPDIWKRHGSGDIKDHDANAKAFMSYYNGELKPGMSSSLGRDASPQELYLGHQQGVAGSTALLNNPTIPASQALAPYYKDSAAPITANGGNPDKMAGDFVGQVNDKYNAAHSEVSGDATNPAAVPLPDAKEPDPSLAAWAAVNQAAGQQAQAQAFQQGPATADILASMGNKLGSGADSSLGLLAAGQPQQSAQPPAMGMGGGSLHAPNAGLASLLNPFLRKKQQLGLLGMA